jgi:aminopeptidase YwaD
MFTGLKPARSPLSLVLSICAVLAAAGLCPPRAGASAAPGQGVLVKIDTPNRDEWDLLRSINAGLLFRCDTYAVVSVEPSALKALDERNLTWSAISVDPGASLYYLMPEEGPPPASLPGFKVLVADKDGALVAASEPEALNARLSGYKVMPLDRAWPVQGSGFRDLDFVNEEVTVNEEYMDLVQRVRADSIAANIQHLEDYGTRYAYTQQCLAAGKWLLKRFWSYGYPDTALAGILIDPKVTLAQGNVSATKTGSTRPDIRIVVGGHYDSIVSGGGASAAKHAPGADDNASGTAAAMEVARILAGVDLDATVQFVLFTAEELGLLGSLDFVRTLASEKVPTESLFFINMDMVGNSDTLPWRTRVYYDNNSRPLAELIVGIGEAYSYTTPILSGASGRSDHVPFWNLGYRAVFLHELDFSPNYHSVDDLLANLEMDYEAEVVKMVLATVLHLARSAEPPTDLTASETEDGGILVQWSDAPDADVIGYRVEAIDAGGVVTKSLFTKENSAVLDPDSLSGAGRVRVRAEDVLGAGDPSGAVKFGEGTTLFAEAYPSLTSASAEFEVFVPGAGADVDASASVFDAAGRLVATLHDGPLRRGTSSFRWDGEISGGDRVPTGVYFFVFDVPGIGSSRAKLIVVR